jgi:hypothetical protein
MAFIFSVKQTKKEKDLPVEVVRGRQQIAVL